jgi:hypothetical protein
MKSVSAQIPKRIEHEGAPLLYMSPTKPARNISIIYQAIKDMPIGTVLQADHDAAGRPYVFFPGQTKISKNTSSITKQNLAHYRHEMGHILDTSLAAAKKNEGKSSVKTDAAAAEKLQKIAMLKPGQGDFTVGELKPLLKKMVNEKDVIQPDTPVRFSKTAPRVPALSGTPKSASKKSKSAAQPNVQKTNDKTNPVTQKKEREIPRKTGYYFSKEASERLRRQRLEYFTVMSNKEIATVKEALFGPQSTVPVYKQDLAIKAMQKLVTDYIEQTCVPAKSMEEFIRESDAKQDLECFSTHWLAAIKNGKKKSAQNINELLRITILPWTKEINTITESVIKNIRRQQSVIGGKLEKLSTHQEKRETEEESSLVVSSSEDESPVRQKNTQDKNPAPTSVLRMPFKKLESDSEEDALYRLVSNPTVEELGREESNESLQQRHSSSFEENSAAEIVAAIMQSSSEEVNLTEFNYQQALRQSQWSMPVIEGLQSFLTTSASQSDLSESDFEAGRLIEGLLADIKLDFYEREIYNANSAEVRYAQTLSEDDSDETSLLSENISGLNIETSQ